MLNTGPPDPKTALRATPRRYWFQTKRMLLSGRSLRKSRRDQATCTPFGTSHRTPWYRQSGRSANQLRSLRMAKTPGKSRYRLQRWPKAQFEPLPSLITDLTSGEAPPFDNTTCSLVLVCGRQSEVADHQQVVNARSALGSKCRLVELENCGSRAAESCPQDFAATVEWFLRADSD